MKSVVVVVIVNVAVDAPAGMVTLDGTLDAELVSESATTAPPLGAAPDRVRVPVDGVPPFTVVGLMLTDNSVAGVTVRFAFLVTPPKVAEIATVVFEDTPEVVTVN